jgi:hypothetical protein
VTVFSHKAKSRASALPAASQATSIAPRKLLCTCQAGAAPCRRHPRHGEENSFATRLSARNHDRMSGASDGSSVGDGGGVEAPPPAVGVRLAWPSVPAGLRYAARWAGGGGGHAAGGLLSGCGRPAEDSDRDARFRQGGRAGTQSFRSAVHDSRHLDATHFDTVRFPPPARAADEFVGAATDGRNAQSPAGSRRHHGRVSGRPSSCNVTWPILPTPRPGPPERAGSPASPVAGNCSRCDDPRHPQRRMPWQRRSATSPSTATTC